MAKRLTVEGMSCAHCIAFVEKALNALDGVTAKADLQGANVSLSKPVADEELIRQVEDAGYTVVKIQDAQ